MRFLENDIHFKLLANTMILHFSSVCLPSSFWYKWSTYISRQFWFCRAFAACSFSDGTEDIVSVEWSTRLVNSKILCLSKTYAGFRLASQVFWLPKLIGLFSTFRYDEAIVWQKVAKVWQKFGTLNFKIREKIELWREEQKFRINRKWFLVDSYFCILCFSFANL